MATIEGFDVSHFQGSISWTDLPLTEVKFGFIKASDGGTGKDERFAANWAGAKSIGLPRGAYHFFRPGDSVADQANNFTSQTGDLELADLPPVLDLEIPGDDPTAWAGIANPAQLAIDWLTRVKALLRRTPIVYTNRQFYKDVLGGDASALNGFPLWFAQFASADDPTIPADWNNWTFWQFFDQGKLSGIDATIDVDLDRFNGSVEDLNAFIASSILPDLAATGSM